MIEGSLVSVLVTSDMSTRVSRVTARAQSRFFFFFWSEYYMAVTIELMHARADIYVYHIYRRQLIIFAKHFGTVHCQFISSKLQSRMLSFRETIAIISRIIQSQFLFSRIIFDTSQNILKRFLRVSFSSLPVLFHNETHKVTKM